MKTFGTILAAVLFAGCAATTSQPATPTAKASATPAPLTGNYSFQERVSDDGLKAALADYDQLISRSHSGSVEARVNVCVKPSGDVENATIVASSGIDGFDRALTKAATTWKYKPVVIADAKTRCKTVSVIYQSEI